MKKERAGGSAYVCHTYYHVYVSMLKEFAKPVEKQGNATIILSTMSTEFEGLPERLRSLNYFKDVLIYEEKNFTEFPEINKYHHPSNNFLVSIWNRFLFTKKYGKSQEKLVPCDFKQFDDIYVYCDSDPIGYYLNWKHIYYHAMEDGLDAIKNIDSARADNVSHFEVKRFLSKKCNIIFIHNGYGKYCLDMEVNDISILKYPCPYYVEASRHDMVNRLTQSEKDMMLRAFVKQIDKIKELISSDTKRMMILTEPLCDLETRKRIFRDLSDRYKGDYEIILKVHPRDYLDYETAFPEHIIIDRTVPMELLNFFEGFHVDLIVAVLTELGSIRFADEKIRLGCDFLDPYEDKSMHLVRFSSVE